MADVEKHKRVHDMLLGPLERPALQWLAARTPQWVNPDILTLIGILGSIVVFAGYALTRLHPAYLWLASLGFVINWYGDSLDGTLARYRKIERPKFGFYIDHTVDAFSQAMVFIGLGVSPFVRLDVAALACIGYLLMSVFAYVTAFVSGKFQISYARFGPTEMRLIAVLANSAVFFFGNPVVRFFLGELTVFDLIVFVIAILLFIVFIVTATNQAIKWKDIDQRIEK
jgi:phosphatidylglycerophosphate synthase